jgi:hypothetical protein
MLVKKPHNPETLTVRPGTWVKAQNAKTDREENGIILGSAKSPGGSIYYWIVFPKRTGDWRYLIQSSHTIHRLIDKPPISDNKLRKYIKRSDVRMPLEEGARIRYLRDGQVCYGNVEHLYTVCRSREATWHVVNIEDESGGRYIEVKDRYVDRVFAKGTREDGQPPKDNGPLVTAIIFFTMGATSLISGVLFKDGLMSFIKTVGEAIKSIGS